MATTGDAQTLFSLPVNAPSTVTRSSISRRTLFLMGCAVLLLVSMVLSLGFGAVTISPIQVLSILLSRIGIDTGVAFETQQELVLLGIRLPRVILGLLVGAGLSLSGALLQGLFRNPLADPSLVGVSSGSALGAAIMIVLSSSLPGFALSALGVFSVGFAAFVGGLIVTFIVYRIATRGSMTSVATMLLAGIALNALCAAGTGALIVLSDDNQLRDLTFWTLGSLGGATWTTILVILPFVLIALIGGPMLARALNAMLLSESEARHLGIRTQQVKRFVIVLAAMTAGAATAVAGLIGFVGLVVPHLVRLMVGPDHRTVIPASALLGATLLVVADLLARVVMQPSEIPIGILTAIAGAPFFLYLLVRSKHREGLI